MIIYLHGFNSSPASFKARLLGERMRALGRAEEFAAPRLPDRPAQAVRAVAAELAKHEPAAVTLVGSSMGGYYATHLAEAYGCRAVLVNPAVRPYELLAGYLGPQQDYHSGETYQFTRAHVDELRALEVARVSPERYLLMVETGDEVLDYRQAVERYRGAKQIVVEGGDHGFSDFGKYLDMVIEFADGRR